MFTKSKESSNGITDDGLYGIENMEFKDPEDAAELFFQREYDIIMEHSDDEIIILEKGITNFEKVYSYPESFIIEKDKGTKFYIMDDSGVNLKEVGESQFIEYGKDDKVELYEIVEKGFDIIKVSEVYLP